MKKINFESATIVKPPQVIVDNVAYDLLPAEVEGGTPITSDDLNKIQSNVEEVFNGEEAMGSIVVDDIKCSNFLDADNPTNSTIKWTGSGETHYFTSEATWKSIKWLLNAKKGEEYTFSYKERNSDNLYLYITELVNNDVVRTIVGDGVQTVNSFTVENDCTLKIEFMNSASVSNVPIEQLMLNRGLKQLPYTPYKKFGYNENESMGKIVVDDITSSNLFNPNDIFAGKWLDDSGQPMTGNEKDILTNFIKVKPNTKYTISGFSSTEQYLIVGSYNSSKTFNSVLVPSQASSTQTVSFTTNATDEYIRCAFSDVNMGSETLQIEKGDATPYKPHKQYGHNSKESMGKIVVDDISCKNLFDKNKTIAGWINYQNNTLISDELYSTSDYIEVNPNTLYKLDLYNASHLEGGGIMQYDANKTWLGDGIPETHNIMTFTTKSETKYVRFVVRNDSKDYVQFKLYKNFEGRTDIVTGQEMPTNEYVDGKRVYVKKIDFGNLENNISNSLETDISNITNKLVRWVATGYYDGENGNYNLPYFVNANTYLGCNAGLSGDNNINFGYSSVGTIWSSTRLVVDFYYTKRTTSSVSTTSLEEGELDG